MIIVMKIITANEECEYKSTQCTIMIGKKSRRNEVYRRKTNSQPHAEYK